MECLGLHSKPKDGVYTENLLTGPEEEEQEEQEQEHGDDEGIFS
jgi:hypothetical protein